MRGYWSPFHQYSTNATWNAASMYVKLEPLLKINQNYSFYHLESYNTENAKKDVKMAMEYIIKSHSWPHSDAVKIIGENVIVVILEKTKKEQTYIENWQQSKL
ncbi:hypothetical protein Q4567_06260 [Aliiglaciecola sp. 2_MG-2023]|uniref:hypothetical protein n=1 Tax=unclassified Aliiglaciecola TaxID=2593648 RepID=UPI0026E39E1F|nr:MULTISPECIES: hypothetical protein [unclassified Aliiglaciecola]MDO6710317.1 hypothetical protein [Aliiglaciecola sp. 2_MG-2023]MDO6751465.1 hypothetical protein [Aliiglaciecola sp. 1_MG-2023]